MCALKLAVGGSGLQWRLSALKCNVTALVAGLKLETCLGQNVKLKMPTQLPSLVDVEKDGFVVFGEHAICRYLARRGKATFATLDISGEEWLAMDEIDLSKHLLSGEKFGASLEGKLGNKKYLQAGDKLGIADVCIGCTLLLAREKGEQLGPVASAWLDNLVKSHPEFVFGLKKTEEDMADCYSALDNYLSQEAPLHSVLSEAVQIVLNEFIPDNVPSERPQLAYGRKVGNKVAADFQLNNAMGLFKKIQDPACKSPKDTATKLKAACEKEPRLVAKIVEQVEVTGPGFINVQLQSSFISKRIQSLVRDGKLKAPHGKRRKIGVDFSSPNVAKEMHVGHLRSTIIGEVICRLLEFSGNDVQRINHTGDWGTQFGMLLTYMKRNHPDYMVNPPTISDLDAFYKAAKKDFDADEGFKEEARLTVVKLQSGNPEALAGWKQFVHITERMIEKVYKRLDVSFPDGTCGESFYNSRIPACVEELEQKGLIEIDDGAKVIRTKACKVPLFVVKRDGGFGYDSTDLAALKYRSQELGLDQIIYVVDSGQEMHFKACFEAAERAGYIGEGICQADHVGFGIVQGKDRKRFRTRAGGTVRLVDLLDEAKKRMVEDLNERIKTDRTTVKQEDTEEYGAKLGYSAVKYCDLKNSREKDYVFDYDEMLKSDGNTAVYLIYSYARMCSIERKIEEQLGCTVDSIIEGHLDNLCISRDRPAEWELAMFLLRFPEALQKSVETLQPHHMCSYIYSLSVTFTHFYGSHRLLVTGEDGKKSLDPEHGKDWVILIRAVRYALRDSFSLVGIDALERV